VGVGWRILLWEEELGFSITNPESPKDGRSAMLEEFGTGRGLPILAAEEEDTYRERIAKPADVVSPNAIRRVCNRFFQEYGLEVELHEIGLPSFRGQYFDVDASASQFDPAFAFFYDNDSMYVTHWFGMPAGFVEGETVRQVHGDGTVSFGIALLEPNTVAVGASPTWVLHAIAKATCPPVFIGDLGGPVTPGDLEGLTSGFVLDESGTFYGPGGLMPQHEFSLAMDNLERRAFFLVGIPYTNLGDFGCHYDPGLYSGFFDVPGVAELQGCFYDGFARTTANLQKSVWSAVNGAKAGGVGFDLWPIRPFCTYPEAPPPPPD
jgi:hypothetical protein